MTTLQAVIIAAFVMSTLGAVAIIALLLVDVLLELRRKPVTATADPLPAKLGTQARCYEGSPSPDEHRTEVVRLKTGSWVRVGTPAHEQAVRSGLVER